MTNAQRAKELEKIRKANRGVLKPRQIVNAAARKAHPLHDSFEWDDTKAGDEYRLWQARHLIRVCVVMLNGNEKPVRTYVSMMDDRTTTGGGYRHLVDVMSDEESRMQLLSEALSDLNGLRRKYRGLRELAPVFEAADEITLTYERQLVET